jgi:hypothetical protein
MPPIIIMPMAMAGSGDSSGGRTYRSAARAANGSADNRTSRSASRRLRNSVSRKRRRSKTQQKQ